MGALGKSREIGWCLDQVEGEKVHDRRSLLEIQSTIGHHFGGFNPSRRRWTTGVVS